MSESCPYCLERERNSRDHIFPQFLGGKTRIRVCKRCNDRFGHTFESAVSQNLAPLIVFLRACGLEAPRPTKWKHAYSDETTGVGFDLSADLQATPSAPLVVRNEAGRLSRAIFSDSKAAERFADSLRAKNIAKEVRITKIEQKGVRPQLKSFNIEIHTELRRLAVKMCVGVAESLNCGRNVLDATARAFVMDKECAETPVRIAYLCYETLETKRPPLSHLVFVEGDSRKNRCYGVVQFFGTIQLLIILSKKYLGQSFAVVGILDVRSGKETFAKTDMLDLEEAPRYISPRDQDEGLHKWGEKLSRQIFLALGPDRGSIRIDPSK